MKKANTVNMHDKPRTYLVPFILIVSLFFLWGFAISMLDVLNKHFQEVLNISRAKSGLIQLVVYGAYFIIALPAGSFIKKYGYKNGVILIFSGRISFLSGSYR
jgi:FHS family L-fucose permease-like MFS transporter